MPRQREAVRSAERSKDSATATSAIEQVRAEIESVIIETAEIVAYDGLTARIGRPKVLAGLILQLASQVHRLDSASVDWFPQLGSLPGSTARRCQRRGKKTCHPQRHPLSHSGRSRLVPAPAGYQLDEVADIRRRHGSTARFLVGAAGPGTFPLGDGIWLLAMRTDSARHLRNAWIRREPERTVTIRAVSGGSVECCAEVPVAVRSSVVAPIQLPGAAGLLEQLEHEPGARRRPRLDLEDEAARAFWNRPSCPEPPQACC